MTDFKTSDNIYMDDKLVETFAHEERAFTFVRTEARTHNESEFKIEKTETIFDSVTEPRDKLSLHMIRNPRKTNAIHASIHPGDWKVGWEDW